MGDMSVISCVEDNKAGERYHRQKEEHKIVILSSCKRGGQTHEPPTILKPPTILGCSPWLSSLKLSEVLRFKPPTVLGHLGCCLGSLPSTRMRLSGLNLPYHKTISY
jgi:hypothetical protein